VPLLRKERKIIRIKKIKYQKKRKKGNIIIIVKKAISRLTTILKKTALLSRNLKKKPRSQN
jgi:hypothetical protein